MECWSVVLRELCAQPEEGRGTSVGVYQALVKLEALTTADEATRAVKEIHDEEKRRRILGDSAEGEDEVALASEDDAKLGQTPACKALDYFGQTDGAHGKALSKTAPSTYSDADTSADGPSETTEYCSDLRSDDERCSDDDRTGAAALVQRFRSAMNIERIKMNIDEYR